MDLFLKKLKSSTGLESNFKKLGISIQKDYRKILLGVNSQRLKNNPIILSSSDIRYIIELMKLKKLNKKKGILFWITGLSGSGKTSLANKIRKSITKKYGPTIVISGDNLRKIFNLNKYDYNSRMLNMKKFIKFSKFITDQKINLIFAVVGLIEKPKIWSRKNIKNYVEIYIKSDIKKIIRNKKKLYRNKKKDNIVV